MRSHYFLGFVALLAVGVVSSPNTAAAACAALPNTFTNGQLTDAGQVMGNFNALHTCIDNNGAVNSGTAGQIGTYNSTGSTISGTAPSDVLDSGFGSTQGSVLYRGASGWSALTPGIAGQVLSSGGTGANPSWWTPPGGLTSPFFVSLSPTTASSFSLATKTGITATLTDMPSGRGPTVNITGSGTDTMASMEQSVLSQSSFTVTACIFMASSMASNWFVGIGVKDTSGKYDAFGWRNSSGLGTFNEFNFSSINTFTTATSIYGLFNPNGPIWLRVRLSGGNLIFSASFDGENWETVKTVSATHYLTPSLSNVGIIADNNSSHAFIIDTLSWSQTTP